MLRERPRLALEPLALRAAPWADYALIDSGGGRKLERYGQVTVARPESQALWRPRAADEAWAAADAVFEPTDEEEAGRWRTSRPLPETWGMRWGETPFLARLSAFRHLGVFPEQAANWGWLRERLTKGPRGRRVLNLFGYTGVASLVSAREGAAVTHVDASKKAIGWARENAALQNGAADSVRWLCEDARKWVAREQRRGSLYDGVILDPPKYGRGPTGEVWRLHEDLPGLIEGCAALLSPDADFLLLNAYAERITGLALASLLSDALDGRGGLIEWGELALAEEDGGREMGLSFFARWTA